jgi:hypothetical protein
MYSLKLYQKIRVVYNVQAKASIGDNPYQEDIAPVFNYPNDSISIPCNIETQFMPA